MKTITIFPLERIIVEKIVLQLGLISRLVASNEKYEKARRVPFPRIEPKYGNVMSYFL
jgi:hypothetical protein